MELHLKRKNEAFHFEAANPNGHTVHIDSSPQAGGEGKGMRPMELLLAGLASCSAIDIGLILQKQKQEIVDFQISIRAARVEEVPSIFSEIHIEYILTGNIDRPKIERAISLSIEKYCSAANIISRSATLHTTYILHHV